MAKKLIPFLLTLTSLSLIFWAAQQQTKVRGKTEISQASVALPQVVQLFLACGDRYLAANINVFRSMMVDTQLMDQPSVQALKKLQLDAAVFNPAHEDNYWIAAATLAWKGEVAATQTILQKATAARFNDIYPPFFYGFNRKFFYNDPVGGANSLRDAAQKGSEADKIALTAIAARWYSQGDDLGLSRSILIGMATQSKNEGLKKYLIERAERVNVLINLREQAAKFKLLTGQSLKSIEELKIHNLIQKIPDDPNGFGFTVDKNGIPQFVSAQEKK